MVTFHQAFVLGVGKVYVIICDGVKLDKYYRRRRDAYLLAKRMNKA